MTGRNIIKAELDELNSSLPASQAPVFNVPNGYFENFAASVLARVKAGSARDEISELSPLLAGISKNNPFKVPENYFNTLEPGIAGSEESLSPVLKEHNKAMPFTVPEGYFETFSTIVTSRVAPAKVIPMYRKWTRMAVAAMVTGIIAVSGMVYFGDKAMAPSVNSQAWVSTKLNNVSDKGLEEFIKATDPVQDNEIASNTSKSQVNAMMHDISESEMDAFLEQLPTDDEELLVIN